MHSHIGDRCRRSPSRCMVAGAAGRCAAALAPFDQLRAAPGGRARRPRARGSTATTRREVQPLVDDLNALLDHRERAVARALAKAGDLAHGLKTPLAVLAQEAERAAAAGHDELAATIGAAGRAHAAADRLSPRARARRRLGRDARRALLGRATSAEGPRAHAASACTPTAASRSTSTSPATHAVRGAARGPRRDARQPARQRLQVGALARRDRRRRRTAAASSSPSTTTARASTPAMREAVLQRGVRADEAAPGSGLRPRHRARSRGALRRHDRARRVAAGRRPCAAAAAGRLIARRSKDRPLPSRELGFVGDALQASHWH